MPFSVDSFCESLVGETLERVKVLLGYSEHTHRLVRQDGEHYIITNDLNMRRINLEVDKGIVTKASRG